MLTGFDDPAGMYYRGESIMMKKTTIVAVVLIAAGLLPVSMAAESYNLERYLSKIEQDNPDLQLSRENAAAAGEGVKQALSALLPSAGLSGGYTRNLKDVKESTAVAAGTTASGGVYPLIYQDIDSNYDNEVSVALGVTQNLVDPVSLAKYGEARKNMELQKTVSEYTRQQILTTAKKLYAQVQLLEAVAEVKKETAATSEEVYRDIGKKYNAGTATELDLRMSEVDWKSDISAQTEAEKNAKLAMMSLKTMAGIPLEEEVTLTENMQLLPEMPEEADLSAVLSARMDYRARILSKTVAEIAYRSSLATFLPTVTGSFTYAYGQYGGYEGQDDWDAYDYTAASIGLKVTVPLFTGGYRISLIKSAQINKEQQEIQIRKKRDEIAQDLVSLQLQMAEAKTQVDSAKALEEASERAMEIAKTSFSSGLGTQLEVSQAMSKYAGARVNLQNTVYAYRASYYDWEFATGRVQK